MKRLVQYIVAGFALVACGLSADAQRANTEPVLPPVQVSSADPVQFAQVAYRQAAHVLKNALPLYGGHDVKAMEFARKAERLTAEFTRDRQGENRTSTGILQTMPRMRSTGKAPAPIAPVLDTEQPYTAQQLKLSNARIQFSLNLIKTANNRLGLIQGVQSISLSEAMLYGQMSAAELDKALYVSRSGK